MEVGNIVLSAISDGTFVARPGHFGDDATAEGHGDLFDRRGQAWLPIGCFLVRSGARFVLVDAGMGPTPRPPATRTTPAACLAVSFPSACGPWGSSGTTSPSSVPSCIPTT
jgi:hypothetical protein